MKGKIRFSEAMIIVPFRPFRKIRHAIQAVETDSDDYTEANDMV